MERCSFLFSMANQSNFHKHKIIRAAGGNRRLKDGTMKIFLNMTSKNGTPELVSMLQYMKETRIDNPEVKVKDARILEMDEIADMLEEEVATLQGIVAKLEENV